MLVGFSLSTNKKLPNPSSVNGFTVATFPPRGKVSKTTSLRYTPGLRVLKLPLWGEAVRTCSD